MNGLQKYQLVQSFINPTRPTDRLIISSIRWRGITARKHKKTGRSRGNIIPCHYFLSFWSANAMLVITKALSVSVWISGPMKVEVEGPRMYKIPDKMNYVNCLGNVLSIASKTAYSRYLFL